MSDERLPESVRDALANLPRLPPGPGERDRLELRAYMLGLAACRAESAEEIARLRLELDGLTKFDAAIAEHVEVNAARRFKAELDAKELASRLRTAEEDVKRLQWDRGLMIGMLRTAGICPWGNGTPVCALGLPGCLCADWGQEMDEMIAARNDHSGREG